MNAFQATPVAASTLQLAGALGFGLLIGWYVYMINRYRKGDVQLGDIVTVIGAIGGTAVLSLFPTGSDLFGAYGIGLAVGFFLYFIVLVAMVSRSKDFTVEWFLDGRRRLPDDKDKWIIPETTDYGSSGRGMGTVRPVVPSEPGANS